MIGNFIGTGDVFISSLELHILENTILYINLDLT